MKIFLSILFLILTFLSTSYADDIENFEIEGISIGENLSKKMSKKEIKQNTINYFNDTRQYYIVGMVNNLNQYDQLEFYLKTSDKNYEIKSIVAGIYFNDLNACLEKKKLVVNDLDQIFSDIEKVSGKKKHEADPKGNSYHYIDQYNIDFPTHIRVECTEFSKEMIDSGMATNSLNIVVMTKEINDWIYSGYK